jgi:hypothetical protein
MLSNFANHYLSSKFEFVVKTAFDSILAPSMLFRSLELFLNDV